VRRLRLQLEDWADGCWVSLVSQSGVVLFATAELAGRPSEEIPARRHISFRNSGAHPAAVLDRTPIVPNGCVMADVVKVFDSSDARTVNDLNVDSIL
jgi:hypothetical protein